MVFAPWRLITRNLKGKILFFLILVTLLPLLVSSFISLRDVRQEILNSAINEEARMAEYGIKMMDMLMHEWASDMVNWSDRNVVKEALRSKSGAALADAFFAAAVKNDSSYDLIMLYDPEGKCISANLPGAVGTSQGDEIWFKQSLAGELVALDFFNSPLLKKVLPKSHGWTTGFAAPVRDEGRITGVITCRVNWWEVQALISQLTIGNTGYAYLTNSSAALIAHPKEDYYLAPLQDPPLNLPQLADLIRREPVGYITYDFENRVEKGKMDHKHVRLQRSEGHGLFKSLNWTMAVGADESELLGRIYNLNQFDQRHPRSGTGF
ncbi:MAG: cache domain-containing protein [Deltaproteobacteria bacterium]|nr:cache domain-containing protein [Deltaproteobacteria bacterium]